MRVYYGGAEAPTLRRRLTTSGAMHFSVSYWHLRDRLPQDGSFPFAERFPAGAKILLDSGGYTANKQREQHEDDFWIQYLDDYLALVGENIDALSLVTEFDFLDYSVDDLWALRYDVYAKLPEEKFLPVWHIEHGFDELIALSQTYAQVALTSEGVKEVGHRLPALSNRSGTRFHGLSVASEKLIVTSGLTSASTTGWTSTQRHGDRVVWTQGRLHRYGKDDVDRAVDTHRGLLEKEGFDVEAIRDGDPEEVTRLTIWSYEEWGNYLSRGGVLSEDPEGVTTPRAEPEAPNVELPASDVATSAPEGGNSVVPRDGSRKVLPVVGFVQKSVQNEHGETVTSAPEMRTGGGSSRQCDTCYIKHLCPEASAGASCAFDIPVEIKSKEQLTAMLTGMLEIQTQRALFARFAEDLEGGYPTDKVSAEFDRLMNMTKKVKDIQDNRDFMEVHIKARGNAGVLSRLFGEEAGQQAREFDRPIDEETTNELMAEIVDAEVE